VVSMTTAFRLEFHSFTKQELTMRKMIVGMKMSMDGKIESPEGFADWIDAWSEDYGLSAEIDTCLLGG
jgi:hypothetical protein